MLELLLEGLSLRVPGRGGLVRRARRGRVREVLRRLSQVHWLRVHGAARRRGSRWKLRPEELRDHGQEPEGNQPKHGLDVGEHIRLCQHRGSF